MKRLMLVGIILGLLVSCATIGVDKYEQFKEEGFENIEMQLTSEEYREDDVDLDYWLSFMSFRLPNVSDDNVNIYREDYLRAVEERYGERIRKHNARAEEIRNNKPKKGDVDFLLESSSHFIDFSKRSDEQLMGFLTNAAIRLSMVFIPNVSMDRQSYDILQNLLDHFRKASVLLFEHGQLSEKEFDSFRISALEIDAGLRRAYSNVRR